MYTGSAPEGATVRYRPNWRHNLSGGSTDLTDRLEARGSTQCLIAAVSGRPRMIEVKHIFTGHHLKLNIQGRASNREMTPSLTVGLLPMLIRKCPILACTDLEDGQNRGYFIGHKIFPKIFWPNRMVLISPAVCGAVVLPVFASHRLAYRRTQDITSAFTSDRRSSATGCRALEDCGVEGV